MKATILTKILSEIIFLFFLFDFSYKAQSQSPNLDCLDGKFENDCYKGMKAIYNDFVYLKSRPFSSQLNPDINFSVLLKRNVQYVFRVCEGSPDNKMIIKLYDENHKMIASNVDAKDNRVISFKPENAGKYYLTSSFEKNNHTNCCLILCGMINKYVPSATTKKSK